MSLNHGLLLYDVAEEPIGNWRENLGTRGMFDKWELLLNSKRVEIIILESLEGDDEGLVCPCKACKTERKRNGSNLEEDLSEASIITADGSEAICEAGCYDYVHAEIKKFMKKHPNGYSSNHEEAI